MRIFVTGATSFLGRAVLTELIKHGHEVWGLARNTASRSMLRAMRANFLHSQATDVDELAEALRDMQAIIHLADTFPTSEAAVEDTWRPSSRIVVGMLRNLLEASERTAARTVIFPSFYAVYGNHDDEWVTEETPLAPDPTSEYFVTAEQVLQASTAWRRSKGVVLRMGLIYGAEAIHTRGLLYGIARGQAPIMGAGQRYWPHIHVSDAAQAIRLAVEQAPAGEVFNICDDEPVQQGQLYQDLAQWVGGPEPPSKGTSELRPYMGSVDLPALRFSVRMSNRKARQWLGFLPQYPTYREGYAAVIRELAEARAEKRT